MNKIGIIQGRLSARPYPKLQEFPWNSWEKEFEYAKDLGFDFIEWIFEKNRWEENPIWTSDGRRRINEIIKKSGVNVESVCADYFLENPFFRRNGYTLKDNVNVLKELIKKMSEIGAKTILLPVLESAEIRCIEDEEILAEAIFEVIPTLQESEIKLGFETELPIDKYLDLIMRFNSNYIGAYYDAGNCTFCGHDMREDMEILKNKVINIHVKDRKKGGSSVFLGTGDTNFKEGIPYLINNGFTGDFVLQTYFEDDYLGEARKNLCYIKQLIGE